MIDLFILHFKGAFLRFLVNLITKCFISRYVKFSFIDRFLLTFFIIIYSLRHFYVGTRYFNLIFCLFGNRFGIGMLRDYVMMNHDDLERTMLDKRHCLKFL